MFRKHLSPETRARIERERREAMRMYHLADRWLAEELLRLARAMQAAVRAQGWYPGDGVYETAFAWDLVPEVAKRLGATVFGPEERLDPAIRAMGNTALRERSALSLLNITLPDDGFALLVREPANGNPFVFALDRLASPAADDPVAKRLREIAGYRGKRFSGAWTPEMACGFDGG